MMCQSPQTKQTMENPHDSSQNSLYLAIFNSYVSHYWRVNVQPDLVSSFAMPMHRFAPDHQAMPCLATDGTDSTHNIGINTGQGLNTSMRSVIFIIKIVSIHGHTAH